MAITVAERAKGRRFDAFGGEIEYVVTSTAPATDISGGFDAEAAYDAVIGAAPAEFNDIPASNVVVNEALVDLTSLQRWSVSAIYSAREPKVFPTSSVQYEFNFVAPVGRIYYSLETRSITGASGLTWPANSFGGKIRGQNDDEEGVDLPNPSPTNSWIFNIPNGTVTLAYQQGVESIMGMVNNGTFQGRAADTMRLVACSGGARNEKDWQLRFDFQFSANRSNVQIGDIAVPSIHGHNLVWDHVNPAAQQSPSGLGATRKPTAIVVERVFERVNMNALGF